MTLLLLTIFLATDPDATIRQLRAENALLRAQVASLQAKVKQLPAPPPKARVAPKVIPILDANSNKLWSDWEHFAWQMKLREVVGERLPAEGCEAWARSVNLVGRKVRWSIDSPRVEELTAAQASAEHARAIVTLEAAENLKPPRSDSLRQHAQRIMARVASLRANGGILIHGAKGNVRLTEVVPGGKSIKGPAKVTGTITSAEYRDGLILIDIAP